MPSPVYNNFQNLITFSRASNATLVDATGRITYAPNNLFTYSEQFNNALWTKLNVTVTADATTAPDGTTTADKLIADATTSQKYINQGLSITAGVTYAISVYAKKSEYNFLQLSMGGSASHAYANFDLANGIVGATGNSPVATSITSVGNGWYRCTLVITSLVTSTNSGLIVPLSANTASRAPTYTGDGTSGIFIWGAQQEAVTYQTTPSTYNPTTTAAYYGPRLDYDPATLALKGLLVEEARTNFMAPSNAVTAGTGTTVTANAAISPDGTSNAYRIAKTDATTPRYTTRSTIMTSASTTTYTVSAYFKYDGYDTTVSLEYNSTTNWGVNWNVIFAVASTGVTVSSTASATATATNVGNGWYLCTATFTTTTVSSPTNPSILTRITGASGVTVLGFGGQIEAGTFATSYIPTVAASVARSADIASMSGSQFAPWYNRNAGTFVAQASQMSLGGRYWSVNDGTTSNYFELRMSGSNPTGLIWVGASVGSVSLTAVSANTYVNSALAVSSANISGSINGNAVVSATPSNYPQGISQLGIGINGANTQLNGWIKSITYYPRQLSNSQLQSLTS